MQGTQYVKVWLARRYVRKDGTVVHYYYLSLPERVAEALNIRAGQYLRVEVKDGRIVLTPIEVSGVGQEG